MIRIPVVLLDVSPTCLESVVCGSVNSKTHSFSLNNVIGFTIHMIMVMLREIFRVGKVFQK